MRVEKNRQGCVKLLVSLIINVAAAQCLVSGANKGPAYEAGTEATTRTAAPSNDFWHPCTVPLPSPAVFQPSYTACATPALYFEVGFRPRE